MGSGKSGFNTINLTYQVIYQNKFGRLIFISYYHSNKLTNMNIKSLSEKVLLASKKDVLKVHLYFKLLQHGIKPFENDIDIILELYLFGGYSNSEQQARFIQICLDKKFKKSDQSLRNTFSKYVTMGVLNKPRNTVLQLNDKFIPTVKCDKIVLQHIISHAE